MDMIPLFGCNWKELKETADAWKNASEMERQVWIDSALDVMNPQEEYETTVLMKEDTTKDIKKKAPDEELSIDEWVDKYMDLSWPEGIDVFD